MSLHKANKMEERKRKISKELKLKIVLKVESGEWTNAYAQRRYNISSHGTILYWIRHLKRPGITLEQQTEVVMAKEDKETKALLLKIKQLEKSLDDAEFKALAYSKLIDVAERELNISIRKKSDTKQSRK